MYDILVKWSCEVKPSCFLSKIKSVRRTMLKLRGGTTAFRIEMGRWHAWSEEEDMKGSVCVDVAVERLRTCATG